VACIIASIVAPLGDRSISIAIDCFVVAREELRCVAFSTFPEVGRLRDEAAAATRFFADFAIGISLG
jgi:hypothetical protein